MATKKSAKPVVLPKIPSALIRLALKDLEKAERSPKVIIDMGQWYETNGHCTVCMAGAVMANTLNAKAVAEKQREADKINYPYITLDHTELEPHNFGKNSGALQAINAFREGDVGSGFESLERSSAKLRGAPYRALLGEFGYKWDDDLLVEEFLPLDVPEYEKDKKGFKKAMRKMADILEEHGL